MSIFSNRKSSAKEEAQAYTSAVIGLVGGQDPLKILRSTPSIVRETVEAADPGVLSKPEADGKWSVRGVLAHLVDSDIVMGWRLRMILSEDTPQITGYDQDLWAEQLRYDDVDHELSLDTFEALRRWNLRLFEEAKPDQLKRFGVHSERGNESVEHLMKMYAGHDTLHINQINRILAAVR